ncbi:MAG: hypothetical protein HY331_00565 [Chloroflexi bacterium]|nr:hypothetical protein [Chloroflexota bacterium]
MLLTLLGSRGLSSLADQLIAGVLVLCDFAAAAVFFVMRQQDHAPVHTLRNRRRR